MDNKQKAVNLSLALLAVALMFIEYAVIVYDSKPQEWALYQVFDGFRAKDMECELPKNLEMPKRFEYEETLGYKIKHWMDGKEITWETIELESKGWYFITAYCSCSKCCYPSTNLTASGIECHYADYENRYSEPTTCAIDRRYHSFGETFYLKSEDRVFVAEDTGSAVKGRHIDIYFPDHSYVQSYGSHWEEVYELKIIKHSFIYDYDLTHPPAPHPKYPYWKTQLHYELFGKNIELEGIDGKGGDEEWLNYLELLSGLHSDVSSS